MSTADAEHDATAPAHEAAEDGAAHRELAPDAEITDPAAYADRFATAVDADAETAWLASDMAGAVAGSHFATGKSPAIIGASCLYVAGLLAEDTHSQRTIAAATPVSAMSIRNRYRDFAEAYAPHAPDQHQWKLRSLADHGIRGPESADRWQYVNASAGKWTGYTQPTDDGNGEATGYTLPERPGVVERVRRRCRRALARLRGGEADV